MAYQSYSSQHGKRGGGGGLGRSLLMAAIGGGADTASSNIPNESFDPLMDEGFLRGGDIPEGGGPGSAPYQYKGNPEDLLGREGFVTGGGKFSTQPYSDTRGFWGRVAGQPNTAEELNLQLEQQGLLGRQATGEAINLAKGMSPIKEQDAFAASAAAERISPEELRRLQSVISDALRQSKIASSADSQFAAAKADTGLKKEQQTQRNQLSIARNEAQIGASRSAAQAMQASRPEFRTAAQASLQAKEISPVDVLRNIRSIELGQGQTRIFRNPGFGGGEMDALTRNLGPSYDAFGAMNELHEIPGQQIPGTQFRTPDIYKNRMMPGGLTIKINPQDMLGDGGGVQTGPSIGAQVTPQILGEQAGSGVLAPATPFQPQGNSNVVSPDDIYNIPPHIAKQLEDPRLTPQAKQQIIMEYYNSMIGALDPTIMDRITPNSSDAVFRSREQQQLRKKLTPNY